MRNFARHYLEMCAAMCIGGVILNAMVFVVGQVLIGLSGPAPAGSRSCAGGGCGPVHLAYGGLDAVPGMAWRPTLEMSGATIGVAVVVVALFAVGVVLQSGLQAWLEASCGPWCVVMLVAMLFRLPLYTGRTGHQMGRQNQMHRA
jgi:hypothetical protein